MRKSFRVALAMISIAAASLFVLGCAGHNHHSSDDNGANYKDIHGLYQVSITVTKDECDDSDVGAVTQGLMEIKQSGATAAVYFTQIGPGQDPQLIFTGTIVGTQVTGSLNQTYPAYQPRGDPSPLHMM